MSITIYHGLPDTPPERSTYLTIGNFDGVHLGHQALAGEMARAAHASGCLAGALTFDRHPLTVLRPDVRLSYLSDMNDRIALLEALGLDFVVVWRFTRESSTTTARDFVSALVNQLHMVSLWTGPDFALGKGREGNVTRLTELGQELGYSMRVVGPVHVGEIGVHSSRVRELLSKEGAVDVAARLLGRPYQLAGVVEHGAGRGRGLGYPTANVTVPAERLVPAYGVYACWAWLGDEGHPAAVSVGVRPTFDNGAVSVEAYLLDLDRDLYGQTLRLSFIQRLRGELRFANVADLVKQMDTDVAETRRLLADPPDDAALGDGAGDAGAAAGGNPAQIAWEELPHTADWAVRVSGESQRQVFARAAAAMFRLQNADISRPITLARAISVTADDPAALLVAWLNQLLLDRETHHEMYTRFEIHDISATGLQAVAYGYDGAPEHTEVKAATYWNLEAGATTTGWSATVTFDV